MTSYRIAPCQLADLRAMARDMRSDDRMEIEGFGFSVRHALHACYLQSPVPMAAHIQFEGGWNIAAVWGDVGGLLDAVGRAWLFTAPCIERLPFAFFRETRKQIADRLQSRILLRSHVKADYTAALRFFRLLGFSVAIAKPMPPYGVPYCEISLRRAQAARLDEAA